MTVNAVAGPEVTLAEKLAELPADLAGADRDRWVAVLSSEGFGGYPGTCSRPRCQRAVVADDMCMTCWLAPADGRRRRRVRAV